MSTVSISWSGPGDPEPPPDPGPVFRADGLVAGRPMWGDWNRADDPMWQDYRWVAALDPLEFADGRDRDTGEAVRPLRVGEVREVEHGGRPAWEAEVVATPGYDPRCSCCPLLHDAEVDRLEWRDVAGPFPDADYPTATRVRLDVGTGVCVLTEALDGTWAGDGHEIRIEAVDEPMDDELFVQSPRSPEDRWPPQPGRWDGPGGGLDEWLAKRGARKAERSRRRQAPGED